MLNVIKFCLEGSVDVFKIEYLNYYDFVRLKFSINF